MKKSPQRSHAGGSLYLVTKTSRGKQLEEEGNLPCEYI
jgi:hypothetical protein